VLSRRRSLSYASTAWLLSGLTPYAVDEAHVAPALSSVAGPVCVAQAGGRAIWLKLVAVLLLLLGPASGFPGVHRVWFCWLPFCSLWVNASAFLAMQQTLLRGSDAQSVNQLRSSGDLAMDRHGC